MYINPDEWKNFLDFIGISGAKSAILSEFDYLYSPFLSIFLTSLSKSESICCVGSICLCRRDFTSVGKNLVAAECQELIDAGSELLHIERILALNEVFDIVEIPCYSTL